MKEKEILKYSSGNTEIEIDTKTATINISTKKMKMITLPITVSVDLLHKEDTKDVNKFIGEKKSDNSIELVFNGLSTLWRKKEYSLIISESAIVFSCKIFGEEQRISRVRYFAGENGIKNNTEKMYAPRFDWSKGAVLFNNDSTESLACQQWLSPPPFYYGLSDGQGWFGLGIAAEPGTMNFQSFDYIPNDKSCFCLDYEGHTIVENYIKLPSIVFFTEPKRSEIDALSTYCDFLEKEHLIYRPQRKIPKWWKEPIFCGWGQQRLDYRKDHDGEENGNWINAGDYSTEVFYRTHLHKLEQKGINPGIVIIDCFWAKYPSFAKPHPLKWPDMREFIDEQHEKGRHVLLWLTPLITAGVPKEACMILDGRQVATDPGSPVFQRIFSDEIRKMVSRDEGCLNADGFKIDFTQNIASERGHFRGYMDNQWAIISEEEHKNHPPLEERNTLIQTAEHIWGVEVIKKYLEIIRSTMKEVKPESLLITHTVNPYFAEDVDMLRLNDMDGTSPDVLGIMSHRAAIAHCSNPYWLIDTDNDLMINKDMWRKYISLQPRLGIPDTYYVDGIAQSREKFNKNDYLLLKETWERYRMEQGLI